MSFPDGSVVKNSLANAGNTGNVSLIFGLEISHGGGNGNPSSILAWVIPWVKKLGGLCPCVHKESHTHTHTYTHTHKSLFISSHFLWSEVYLLTGVFKLFIFSQFLIKQGISIYFVICFLFPLFLIALFPFYCFPVCFLNIF